MAQKDWNTPADKNGTFGFTPSKRTNPFGTDAHKGPAAPVPPTPIAGVGAESASPLIETHVAIVPVPESERERFELAATRWPIPDDGAWARRYAAEVEKRSGFYDPPDIRSTPRRLERIHDEYPEIHIWADRIALAWRNRQFAELGPAMRARVIAAMMLTSREANDPSSRLGAIDGYLRGLRQDARARALACVDTITRTLLNIVGVVGALGANKADVQFHAEVATGAITLAGMGSRLGVLLGSGALPADPTIDQIIALAGRLESLPAKPSGDEIREALEAISGVLGDLVGDT